jgi:hypothetical protein
MGAAGEMLGRQAMEETERLESLERLQVNLELQAEPVAMAAQEELQVLEGQPVVCLARLVRMASTVTEVRQAMEATVAQALTERRESLE